MASMSTGMTPVLEGNGGEFDINLVKSWQGIKGVDAVIVTVAHDHFKGIKLSELKKSMNKAPILADIRQIFNRDEAEKEGFYYRTL